MLFEIYDIFGRFRGKLTVSAGKTSAEGLQVAKALVGEGASITPADDAARHEIERHGRRADRWERYARLEAGQ